VRRAGRPSEARWIRARIGALAVLLLAGIAVVAGRAFQLQVLRSEREAVDHYLSELRLRPRRGVVTDRNGVLLAVSADAQSAYADPDLLFGGGLRKEELDANPRLRAEKRQEGEARLRKAARLLGQDPQALVRKAARGGRFLWLERRLLPDKEAALRDWLAREKVKAIALVPEPRRYYPKAELAGSLLGMVDEDGAGVAGVELAREDDLQGVPAQLRSLRDGRGQLVLSDPPVDGREREGDRVELTIDQGIQATAERALARVKQSSRALSAMAVALAPATGEVLALASWTSANANAPRSLDEVRDRPVADAFEPGSTVKAFTLAAALDAGALQPLDAIDCGNGTLSIGAHTIHDHAALGWAGPSKIIAQSSNVGAARVAARLGRERLRAGLAAFGFGERTDVGLPGEARGQLLLARSDIALATQAFGQGPITASALQITNAMAALANGGVLMKPLLVRRVLDPVNGDVVEEGQPTAVRRAVSAETAATLTRWLVGVIEDPRGTGHRAALDGWHAAGKTGTAQKPDAVSGGYSADRRFSSFVGFAPAEAPRIVIGVFVDEPKGEVFGGEVAAPAFKEIAEYALRVMDVRPAPALAARPAPAREPAAPVALAQADRRGDDEEDDPAAVEWSSPAVGEGRVAVPALSGLPARSAIRTLEAVDLAAELRGSGRVVEQSPPPGRAVERGTRVRMTLAPAG
jgi:cell division protein FtsI (penicillin-binding protein 3)